MLTLRDFVKALAPDLLEEIPDEVLDTPFDEELDEDLEEPPPRHDEIEPYGW